MTSELDGIMPKQRNSGVLAARLLIGLIVLDLRRGVLRCLPPDQALASVDMDHALAILGLRLHRPREPLPVDLVEVEPRD